MTLDDLQLMFNRALFLTFNKKKLLCVFSVLAGCGLLAVFFRGLAFTSGYWMSLSLSFLPIFLCSGILLALGIFLVRIYHDEVKGKEVSMRSVFLKSWDILLGAAYFAFPIMLIYLVAWTGLGFFLLLKEIPSIGEPIGVVLSFAPFLLNLFSLLLCVFSLGILFFVAPMIALQGKVPVAQVSEGLMKRIKENVFLNLLMSLVAISPLLISVFLLTLAAFMSGSVSETTVTSLQVALTWFFMMIPFVALLAPSVTFFFQFAAEVHVFFKKRQQAAQ